MAKFLPKVAFICVHNSCRSQMAEAISKLLAAEVFQAYSAGTEECDAINPDAVETIRDLYHVDMRETQRPKLLEELPEVDVVVTMGCDVACPFVQATLRKEWKIDDPAGRGKAVFAETARIIEEKVLQLKEEIKTKKWEE